ncbi:dihydroxyacetone kinase subunit L [Streptococcus equinus]|nr:dihydroxyacetone kinase subunit L [Streptococcus equinus]
MDKTVAVEWMILFNQKVQEEKDYLSELDGPIGDGDHGANLARGMAAAIEALNTSDPQSTADVLKTVSMALISKVGGASGPLYGSAFMGMMKAEQAGQDLAGVLEAGADMIEKRGHAQVGEKTMIDVWRPVIEAVKRGQLTNEVIDQAVLSTKDVVATKGRASYVGERSIGHIDPGSYSSGLLFKALLEAEE